MVQNGRKKDNWHDKSHSYRHSFRLVQFWHLGAHVWKNGWHYTAVSLRASDLRKKQVKLIPLVHLPAETNIQRTGDEAQGLPRQNIDTISSFKGWNCSSEFGFKDSHSWWLTKSCATAQHTNCTTTHHARPLSLQLSSGPSAGWACGWTSKP